MGDFADCWEISKTHTIKTCGGCDSDDVKIIQSKGKFIVEDQTGRVKIPDAYGVILDAEQNIYKGPNLLGRLLMELRDRQGQLDYQLPDDAFDFIQILPILYEYNNIFQQDNFQIPNIEDRNLLWTQQQNAY